STLLRSLGKYQERTEPPYILDGEIAGIVASAPASTGLHTGERVAAPSAPSFAAECVTVPAASVLRLPAHLSLIQGACLRNFEPALFALESRGRVRVGEVLLVHGAGGGSGVAAIQVAKALGCRVVGVVSSAAKADVAREAGADRVLLADGEWEAEAVRLTGGR